MKQKDAMKYLTTMMLALQRIRGIMDEQGIITNNDGLMTPEDASKMWKWVWGDMSILPSLSSLIDRSEVSGKLSPHDFYNMMIIAIQLEPLIGAVSRMIDDTFPERVSIQWLWGWELE